ncbi:MAG: PCYCGC motif-containing (lipo)protein [Candidatus Micrarchaeia archaeon]
MEGEPQSELTKEAKRQAWLQKKARREKIVLAAIAIPLLALAALALKGFFVKEPPIAGTEGASLPNYAFVSAAAEKAYRIALAEPELLRNLPCYCGCGGHAGHRHNLDCFVHDDGSFDSHAAYCVTCQNIAIEGYELKRQGKSLKEIRDYIDRKYSQFGRPTPTPPVLA